jgi:hypothetical protein
MPEGQLRIEVIADTGAPFVVMFEPTGMTYELAGGERMFADVTEVIINRIEVANIAGGISITAPGPVTTRDSDGKELHRLN